MRKLLITAAVFFLSSAANAGHKECEYHGNGSFVRSKLTGLKGMVVSHWRADDDKQAARNCRFSVRWVTESGWVYTIEKMRPYELEKYVGKTKPVFTPPSVPTQNPVEGLDFGG